MAISPTGLKKVLTDVKPDVKVDITPLYAVAGATDALVAKLREVPGRVQAFKPALTVEPKAVREQIEARFATLRTAVVGLPVKAEAKASELSDKVVDTATSTYGVLATRGEKVVRAIRKQPEVAHAADQVKAAKAKSKAATTTARKSAAATNRAAKAATTSASNAVEAVAEAADAAIDQIG